MNAVEIEEAVSELARAPFDPDEFSFAFLAALGNREKQSCEFAPARLTTPDRFGDQVSSQEWFLVPLPAIHEAIERVQDGSLHRYEYRLEEAALVPRARQSAGRPQ